jgi:hypothetical protein
MFPAVVVVHRPVGINIIVPPVETGHGAVMVTIAVVPDTKLTSDVGAIVAEDAMVGATFPVATKFEIKFCVVSAFEITTFPVTRKVVAPSDPCISTVTRFDVDATLSVVEYTNGIVSVSELKMVLVTLDVIPAVNKLFVVTAFEAKILPVTLIVLFAFDMVKVFAKRLVVVTAFEMYTLPFTSSVEFGFANVLILSPLFVRRIFSFMLPSDPDELLTKN